MEPSALLPTMVRVLEDPSLRNRQRVFQDRTDAGRHLAAFITENIALDRPLVCAIPAGGVAVGVELAAVFQAPMILGVVRKLKIPWNPEAGFGAMTWDGTIFLNDPLVRQLQLTPDEIGAAATATQEIIRQRVERFTGGKPRLSARGLQVILTDDGLASGYTMLAAIEAISLEEPAEIIVAVPTGSAGAVSVVSEKTGTIICLNFKDRYPFAVADAYRRWHDLSDEEVMESLRTLDSNQGT
ncbi:MAG: phosphoribosyltransferase [Methanoregulaceae archaeon]|nr:phosphoribosyltransferase [Methanoregulaceae archaeon]